MNPPPPIPHDCGRATFRAKTVATAASTALPPASSTPRPTRAAAGDSVAMTPSVPCTPGRNCEPWTACAGTAETASRARLRVRTVRRTLEVLPLGCASCAEPRAMHRLGEARADDHAGEQSGHRGQHVHDRLVADQAREARPVLDVARGGLHGTARHGDQQA